MFEKPLWGWGKCCTWNDWPHRVELIWPRTQAPWPILKSKFIFEIIWYQSNMLHLLSSERFHEWFQSRRKINYSCLGSSRILTSHFSCWPWSSLFVCFALITRRSCWVLRDWKLLFCPIETSTRGSGYEIHSLWPIWPPHGLILINEMKRNWYCIRRHMLSLWTFIISFSRHLITSSVIDQSGPIN